MRAERALALSDEWIFALKVERTFSLSEFLLWKLGKFLLLNDEWNFVFERQVKMMNFYFEWWVKTERASFAFVWNGANKLTSPAWGDEFRQRLEFIALQAGYLFLWSIQIYLDLDTLRGFCIFEIFISLLSLFVYLWHFVFFKIS